jgi:hypothetical protein
MSSRSCVGRRGTTKTHGGRSESFIEPFVAMSTLCSSLRANTDYCQIKLTAEIKTSNTAYSNTRTLFQHPELKIAQALLLSREEYRRVKPVRAAPAAAARPSNAFDQQETSLQSCGRPTKAITEQHELLSEEVVSYSANVVAGIAKLKEAALADKAELKMWKAKTLALERRTRESPQVRVLAASPDAACAMPWAMVC